MKYKPDNPTHPHDNDNVELKPPWQTPAEFLQMVREEKEYLRQLFATDFRMRSDPEKRKYWDELHAMEECCLYHFCREP